MPYIWANASNPQVCEAIVQQMEGIPAECHHPRSLRNWDLMGGAIMEIAQGGVPTKAVLDEEAVMQRCPLVSTPAEGFHRSGKVVKTNATASQTPWIFLPSD